MIAAGSLDRRLTLKRFQPAAENSFGEQTGSFVKIADIWGQALSLLNRDIVRMAGSVTGSEHKYRVRYRPDIQVGCQLVDRAGTTLEITSVEEVGRRQELIVIARAV